MSIRKYAHDEDVFHYSLTLKNKQRSGTIRSNHRWKVDFSSTDLKNVP